MSWPESRAGPGSPDCPDLMLHGQTLCSPPPPPSPLSPVYLSFFEEECRAIAARLRLGAEPPPGSEELSALQPEPSTGLGKLSALQPEPSTGLGELSPLQPEPSTGLGELSALQPAPAGPITSTPLPVPSHGRVPQLSVSDCEAAAAPSPTRREPGCLPQPTAGGGSGTRLARPSQRARHAAGRLSAGHPGSPARTPGRGRGRLALARTRASLGLRLPAAGTGRGAWETRLPGKPPGTRLKLTSPARSRLQHVSGATQQAQPSTRPKPALREMKSNSAPASCLTRGREASAVKVGSRKQPPSRLSTAIPTVASRSSLRPPGKVASSKRFCLSNESTAQELVCNRTQELKENGESKESLIAAGTVLGAGKANQTWVCVECSLSCGLAPGLTSRCEDAVSAKQSAGDQLSQELERVKKELEQVKKELEQVKGELADKTAQCEAYQQTISLQAQLRAAGSASSAVGVRWRSDRIGAGAAGPRPSSRQRRRIKLSSPDGDRIGGSRAEAVGSRAAELFGDGGLL
ncbi:uncharacterized protein LOC130577303 [Malurus melanocephalus]|uniref:uncharacterized protein LOC130577303 n=1 Tax=Malurus melanocephalus TaxID=175006 RepID=UPI0025491A23|nr:uncharacterized protein LOC130577303 [Malurus melanocephalus]